MISKKEIRQFSWFYILLMIRWNLVSLAGILSGGLVIAFILKNYLGVNYKFWWLNDTVDGDFGETKWLEDNNLKPGIWSAILWWKRNHSWNYISQFNPAWHAGETQEFLVIKDTLTSKDENGRFTRADKNKKIYGVYYIAYRIDDNIYCQFSYANKYFHIQLGGGSEYRFRTSWF